MNENIKSKLKEIREEVLVFLLAVWMLIPVLKDLKLTSSFTFKYEYTYMIIVGIIGGIFLILDIYNNFKKRENRKEYNKEILPITLLGMFMIWTLISTVFSPNVNNALYGTSYRRDGYITYLIYAGFFSCAFFIKSKQNRRELVKMFVVTALLNIIIVFLYNKGICTNVINRRNLRVTSFYHFNHYGYYLLLATVSSNFLFITDKNKIMKILYLFLYAFFLYYLILNNTFGCYLALIITLIFFVVYCICYKKNRCLSILSIIIFILMSFFNQETRTITQNNINSMFKDIQNIINAVQINYTKTSETNNTKTQEVTSTTKNEEVTNNTKTQEVTSTTKTKEETNDKSKEEAIKLAEKAGTGRAKLWINGIKFFLERPILGYGPENLEAKYLEVGMKRQDRPHNLLIQLATTSGIIGLATYVAAIGIILIRALKRMKMENDVHVIAFFVVVAYLISAMFGNSMYYTSPYFFIFLGLLMSENIIRIKNK